MKYENIVEAVFVSRPNRFIATVKVNGKLEAAHVKNTGRCIELLVPGAVVYLEDFSGRMGTRKLRYSLISVYKGNMLVNMDSQAPNKATAEALADGRISIPGMSRLTLIRPETQYGSSRFDFYIEDEDGRKGFLEIKGCTLEKDGAASFPDAPTERGVKHINELIKAREDGYITGIIFILQMEGIKCIMPNDETHPEFGQALREAEKKGVNILAYECNVTSDTLEVSKPVRVETGR